MKIFIKQVLVFLRTVILCTLQISVSSCYISPKSRNQSYYSVNNLKGASTTKRFSLIALDSLHEGSYLVKFQPGTVCLIINMGDYKLWAVKDEFPLRVTLKDDSPWSLYDLKKANWKDKRTVLKQDDPRISQFENATSVYALNSIVNMTVLDLKPIYEKVQNCRGVLLVGKKRYYYFRNNYNFKLYSYGFMYQAFFPNALDSYHKIIIESNELRDIEEAASRYAEKHRSTVEQNTDMDDKP